MARIARSGKDIARNAPEIGHAVHGDAKGSPPCIFDFHPRKLREDLQHGFSRPFLQIPGETVAIAFPAPEQKAPVLGQAEIVDHELAVRHRHIVPDQGARYVCAKRSGGHDEIVDRHDPPCHLRGKIAQITIGPQGHETGRYLRAVCGDGGRIALRNAGDPGVFKDAHPRSFARPGKAQRKVQRMQMPRPPVHGATLIGTGPKRGADLLPVPVCNVLIPIFFLHLFHIGPCMTQILPAQLRMQNPFRVTTGNLVVPDQGTYKGLGFFGQVPQGAGAGFAHHSFQIVRVHPLPGSHLSAIAPRGTKPHPLRFKKDGVISLLCQMQRRRKTRIPPPDDTHVAGKFPLQRGTCRGRGGTGRIVGGRVFPRPVVDEKQVHCRCLKR